MPDVDSRTYGQDGLPDAAHRVHAGRRARRSCATCFRSSAALDRETSSTTRSCSSKLDAEPQFGRKIWGLLSLELWQQEFHDRACARIERLLNEATLQSTDDRRAHYESTDYRRSGIYRIAPGGSAPRARRRQSLVIDNFATGRRDNLEPRPKLQRRSKGSIADAAVVNARVRRSASPMSSSMPRRRTRIPTDWAEDARTNVLGHRVTSFAPAARRRRQAADLLPDRALLRAASRRAAHHAYAPDSSGRQQLRHQQDGRRAIRRSSAAWTTCRSGSPTRTARETSAVRCRRSFSASRPARPASSWTRAATSFSSTISWRWSMKAHRRRRPNGRVPRVVWQRTTPIKELFDETLRRAEHHARNGPWRSVQRNPDDVFSILLDPSKTNQDFNWRTQHAAARRRAAARSRTTRQRGITRDISPTSRDRSADEAHA